MNLRSSILFISTLLCLSFDYSYTFVLRPNRAQVQVVKQTSLSPSFTTKSKSSTSQRQQSNTAFLKKDSDSDDGKPKKTISVITGGNGFLGKAILNEIVSSSNNVQQQQIIYSLVRSHKVNTEKEFLQSVYDDFDDDSSTSSKGCSFNVFPYDMLDEGKSIKDCLVHINDNYCTKEDDDTQTDIVIYHTASVFGPTENHTQTALDNVKGTEDLLYSTISTYDEKTENKKNIHVIFTSSMAAVRATNQTPKNGKFYTEQDWNTESKLGVNWGSSYQWSKMKSEQRAWEIVNDYNNSNKQKNKINFVSICPSFIFGPLSTAEQKQQKQQQQSSSTSYSIDLVTQWSYGKSEVQSRLCVDVRDVAKAHVLAATLPKEEDDGGNEGKRYIVSSETRIPSIEIARAIQKIHDEEYSESSSSNSDVVITADTEFDGGFIKIGEKEVECIERLKKDLGLDISKRPLTETFEDMARQVYAANNDKK